VRLDPDPHLRLDRGVCAKQRKKTMRRAAGDDLDGAEVVKMLECLHDVPVERIEIPLRLGEESLPELRNTRFMQLAFRDELLFIFLRRLDLLPQILRELFFECG